jgi:hypothetical protein
MTWEMWCGIIAKMYPVGWDYHDPAVIEQVCILEQLLCEGKLPLTCERCGHSLSQHQFDFKVTSLDHGCSHETTRSFCNEMSCWAYRNERSLCTEYMGMYVEH